MIYAIAANERSRRRPPAQRLRKSRTKDRTVQITGFTKLIYILADPVEHIQVTAVLNRLFDEWNVDASVSPLHVRAADLPNVVTALRAMQNLAGCGVTIPHKIAIMSLIDQCSERAQRIGAVNYVRRERDGTLVGDNFDGIGFISGLAGDGVAVRAKSALLVGAGGASRAIAFALAEAGVSHLAIANRAREKALELAGAIGAAYPSCRISVQDADPTGFDLVVNATSLGMKEGDPLPVDVTKLSPGSIVAEIVMRPTLTPLVIASRERGCQVVLGRRMLDEQFGEVRKFLSL
jgi:shikimate dehydrogenase